MIEVTDRGLYCAGADSYIDPWAAVERAVITHAHSDHAHPGCGAYLCSDPCAVLLQERFGADARIQSVPYRQPVHFDGFEVSFHPAGHVLGSAQVRIAHKGEVWVVSGDYKLHADPTCAPFELVPCNTFITESTYALPVYRWPQPEDVFVQINNWWAANQVIGRTSVLFAYSLGKSSRVLSGIDATLGPIFVHGAVEKFLRSYAAAGIALPPVERADSPRARTERVRALVIAPPSAAGSLWMRRFGEASTAFVSGWMQIRGARRRRAVDRGFVLSDHADWNGLLKAIDATGAENIGVTHGHAGVLTRWLREQGRNANVIPTRFEPAAED